MISLQHVTKQFEDTESPAVDDVSIEVKHGEFLVLLGESGCGKTTTLKMINRLIEPTSGTIMVGDRDTSQISPVQLRRSIGYVFQEIGLFPHMTVRQNVGAVPHLLGWEELRIRSRTDELLELVGLDAAEFADRLPENLSGGQRQRVGVARALAVEPEVMLMDEPFGALDPITRDALQDEFRSLQQRLNLTVVMVTHDMTEALLLADRIAVMQAGKIIAVGSPHQLLEDRQHEYVEALLSTPRKQAKRLIDLADEDRER